VIKTLTNDEVYTLLSHLCVTDESNKPKQVQARNYALALFMIDAGLRVGEVIQLRVSDLVYQGEVVRLLTVRAEIAKGKREREIPVSLRLIETINLLKECYWYWKPFLTDHYAFFVTDKETHIGRRQVERIITEAGMLALGLHITPHTLRHTFGTRILRKSNIRVAQQLLGH